VRFVLPASATVAGVLVDPRGVPMPFAPVSAQHPETRIARSTVSGPDGSFSLERIPAGRVQLIAFIARSKAAKTDLFRDVINR
jgi:hypothetical protein